MLSGSWIEASRVFGQDGPDTEEKTIDVWERGGTVLNHGEDAPCGVLGVAGYSCCGG